MHLKKKKLLQYCSCPMLSNSSSSLQNILRPLGSTWLCLQTPANAKISSGSLRSSYKAPCNLFFLPSALALFLFTLEVHEQEEAKNKLWDSLSFHLSLILFALQQLSYRLCPLQYGVFEGRCYISLTKFCLVYPENTNEVLATCHWPFCPFFFIQPSVHPWCSGVS